MQLYFIRHGIAVDLIASKVKNDAARWLTDKGILQMEKNAKGVEKIVPQLECIFSSRYLRAKQTANIIAQVYDPPPPIQLTASLKPGATLTDIEKLCQKITEKGRVGFVGHQPDLSHIISELIDTPNPANIEMRKGAVCRIDVKGAPLPGSGKLIFLLQPKYLRAYHS